jgi:hypothetical protein
MPPRPFAVRLAVRLAAAFAFAWAAAPGAARATPSFPADVQIHYGLSAVPVDPPLGCELCHMDDSGGLPPTLRPFGRLLYTQLGVQPYDDASLKTALGELDTQYTNLADDIATGKDPNDDLAGGSEGGAAIDQDPVPMYGCAVAPGSRAGAWGTAGIFAACAAFAVYRPKRRTRPSQPRAR